MNREHKPETTAQTPIRADCLGDFRRAVSSSFVPLRLTSDHTGPFSATLTSAKADEIVFTEVSATPHVVERSPDAIERGGSGFYKVSLLLAGTGILVQDGREVIMQPGDLSFYDTSRPYSLLFGQEFRNLIMMFPKDRLEFPSFLTDSLTAVSLGEQHPIAHTIAPFIAQAFPQLNLLNAGTRTKLAHTSLDLMSTMLSAIFDVSAEPLNPRQVLLKRVFSYINDRLASPDLTPGSIAAAHYISTRHLHSLFAEVDTTVSAWIRERRLDRCRNDLLDATLAHRSIAAIAASWGFVDAAHFSRTFRATYGVTPSELRRG